MPTNSRTPAQPPTPVRLAAEMRIWLQHQAIDNHRSLSGEITYRLEQSRAQEAQKGKP